MTKGKESTNPTEKVLEDKLFNSINFSTEWMKYGYKEQRYGSWDRLENIMDGLKKGYGTVMLIWYMKNKAWWNNEMIKVKPWA